MDNEQQPNNVKVSVQSAFEIKYDLSSATIIVTG